MKTEFIEQDRSLETVVENGNQRILREALMRLGPNGENWAKGDSVALEPSVNGPFCALTATHDYKAWRLEACGILHSIAAKARFESVQRWNDAPERTFDEVRAAFLRAIDLAGHKALPQ